MGLMETNPAAIVAGVNMASRSPVYGMPATIAAMPHHTTQHLDCIVTRYTEGSVSHLPQDRLIPDSAAAPECRRVINMETAPRHGPPGGRGRGASS
jgi:hypothetical protein